VKLPPVTPLAEDRMKSRSKSRLLVALALLVLAATIAGIAALRRHRSWVSYPDAELASIKNAHDYKGGPACPVCHLERDARLKADPVVLCQRCHKFIHKNHPVNVTVKLGTGKDLPLWAKDHVVCHTCHDPHDLKSFGDGLRMKFDQLCLRCHDKH